MKDSLSIIESYVLKMDGVILDWNTFETNCSIDDLVQEYKITEWKEGIETTQIGLLFDISKEDDKLVFHFTKTE